MQSRVPLGPGKFNVVVLVIICVTTFECFKMQMVINFAPVSLNNKKVNFYTCPRLTFLKKNATQNAYKSISEPLNFKIFRGGMPPDPLAARAFGARNLPHLVLKSGYGPESYVHLDLFAHTNICRKYLIKLSIK